MSTKRTKYETREAWLHAVKDRLHSIFETAGTPIPRNVRLACGFSSHGALGQKNFVAGECFPATASKDRVFEILISPRLEAFGAISTLLHELIHAAVGLDQQHGGRFASTAKALGLVGKMTHTKAGPELTRTLNSILKDVGPYPHAPLNVFGEDKKKQSTRLLKASCETCGYIVRVTRKWLEQEGPPICPADEGEHGAMLAEDPEDGSDE